MDVTQVELPLKEWSKPYQERLNDLVNPDRAACLLWRVNVAPEISEADHLGQIFIYLFFANVKIERDCLVQEQALKVWSLTKIEKKCTKNNVLVVSFIRQYFLSLYLKCKHLSWKAVVSPLSPEPSHHRHPIGSRKGRSHQKHGHIGCC